MSTTDFDEYIRGQWFAPIAERLEAFENKAGVFEEIGVAAEPSSPEWALNCAVKAIRPFGEVAGMPFGTKFESRHVGAMVGAKASVCAAMVQSHKHAKAWSQKSRENFVRVFGLEATEHAERIWEKFAETLQPEFETIRRFAVNLAMRQNYFEDVEFHRGLSKGLTFIQEVRKTVRKVRTKAERDTQNRMAVYWFAITNCEAIEANRSAISWPDLSVGCDEAFDYKVSIDEDAFKKILQRCGLRIGKPGRRTEVKI